MPLQLSKGRRVPSFQLTTSDNTNNRLPTQVTFSNGMKDEMILKATKENKCNYLGHLHGDPISVIGASGCLTKHGDKMEITLISEHSFHNMFILDFDGNADIVENPFMKEGMSHSMIYF